MAGRPSARCLIPSGRPFRVRKWPQIGRSSSRSCATPAFVRPGALEKSLPLTMNSSCNPSKISMRRVSACSPRPSQESIRGFFAPDLPIPRYPPKCGVLKCWKIVCGPQIGRWREGIQNSPNFSPRHSLEQRLPRARAWPAFAQPASVLHWRPWCTPEAPGLSDCRRSRALPSCAADDSRVRHSRSI